MPPENRAALAFRVVDQLTSLLLDARDGDREAFAAAIQIADPPVRRFVTALIDCDEVDDTVQDTFIRAWHSLGRYRVEASGQTWLLAIARRACADVVRTRRRRRRLVERCRAEQSTSVEPGPEETSALMDLVRALPCDRSEAFVLTQLIGLSYAEAAQVCSVPIGTIRSRVARARDELIVQHRDAAAG
jgi:RNA polymerase sigma-70 factor (ECF subfamily)